MSSPTFQPRLESLEDRIALSGTSAPPEIPHHDAVPAMVRSEHDALAGVMQSNHAETEHESSYTVTRNADGGLHIAFSDLPEGAFLVSRAQGMQWSMPMEKDQVIDLPPGFIGKLTLVHGNEQVELDLTLTGGSHEAFSEKSEREAEGRKEQLEAALEVEEEAEHKRHIHWHAPHPPHEHFHPPHPHEDHDHVHIHLPHFHRHEDHEHEKDGENLDELAHHTQDAERLFMEAGGNGNAQIQKEKLAKAAQQELGAIQHAIQKKGDNHVHQEQKDALERRMHHLHEVLKELGVAEQHHEKEASVAPLLIPENEELTLRQRMAIADAIAQQLAQAS